MTSSINLLILKKTRLRSMWPPKMEISKLTKRTSCPNSMQLKTAESCEKSISDSYPWWGLYTSSSRLTTPTPQLLKSSKLVSRVTFLRSWKCQQTNIIGFRQSTLSVLDLFPRNCNLSTSLERHRFELSMIEKCPGQTLISLLAWLGSFRDT